jgi:Tol biopolymer transport system component
MMPSWSGDGRSIYYASDRTGSWQIWKQPVAGGSAIQITRRGGREAKESPDGKFLYYTGTDQAGLWRVPTNGGDEVSVAELAGIRHHRHWALADGGIYFLSREQSTWTVCFLDFASKRIATVFTMPGKPVFGSPGLTISPDGRTILYSQVDQQGSDVMLLENFE